ncbi:myrosinase 1-like isoform X2 [Venturia canescens]|uniref:myrosinase 1-like isoform X2 n=1 Tax=Venturia canescens TaxID=32260 RepID=UPI001C9D4229|nr:myrosinase 1-like isoform X2 [Venturia canescens]
MMKMIACLFMIYFLPSAVRTDANISEHMKFPPDFILGVAGAAYQIEGGWNASDKGINVWDEYTHRNPSPIQDGSNGDVACDSYHKYKEDVELLGDLGVGYYRISLSWSRILPTGFPNKVSHDGIQYYKNLLDELKTKGIKPLVTIYHWDHPAILEEMGGWTNELMVTWFADYARVIFNELGDRVEIFATLNEPTSYCTRPSDEPQISPGTALPGISPYICMHNSLKAHAKVYHMYDKEYRKQQNGKIGIVLGCANAYPKNSNDTETPEVYFSFFCGWAADPIFSESGDYPEVMKNRIGENSKMEGYPRSRLPAFTQDEINYIRGSADYIGLNHYSSVLTEPAPKSNTTLWYRDHGVYTSFNASWPRSASSWLRVVPQGFGHLLRILKNRYNNFPVYVLENGFSDDGTSLNDTQRIQYLHDYIKELLLAVNRDKCPVKGYFVWSLLDNFEWNDGYKFRFGIVNVDFQKSDRPRTPKQSFEWVKQLIRTRELPPV